MSTTSQASQRMKTVSLRLVRLLRQEQLTST